MLPCNLVALRAHRASAWLPCTLSITCKSPSTVHQYIDFIVQVQLLAQPYISAFWLIMGAVPKRVGDL